MKYSPGAMRETNAELDLRIAEKVRTGMLIKIFEMEKLSAYINL